MPSRNVPKTDIPDSYYHVYARGASKQQIYCDRQDYNYFINLFARYLSAEPSVDKAGTSYPHYVNKIDLLAYCLMGNHFHLLVYQRDKGAMSQLMKSVMTSYGRYFNLKYKRSGSLYESTYKASLVSSNTYLQHITRYIHLNPRYWKRYPYSSLAHYLKAAESEWLKPERVTDLFDSPSEYSLFLEDYEDQKVMIEELKNELADQ